MTTTERVRALRVRLETLRADGNTAVDLDTLDEYLAAAELDASEAPPIFGARDVSLMEAGLRAHEGSLKSAILINGGAAVALLAFVGNLTTKEPTLARLSVNGFGHAMLVFAGGVLLGGVGQAVSHFIAVFGLKSKSEWAGWTSIVVMLFILGAFAAFACGTWEAFRAIPS